MRCLGSWKLIRLGRRGIFYARGWFRRLQGWHGALEFPAAISLIKPLRILFGWFGPCLAAAAQCASEVGWALGIEGLPAFFAVGRDLNQHVVHQRLHVPRLVCRQIA